MQKGQKTWDNLSRGYFNNFNEDEIELEAVENLYFAWPVIKKFVKKNIKNSKNKRALDFGCGTGQVCTELNSLGFIAGGIDYSSGMIKVAKKSIDRRVHLYLGDSKKAVEVAKKEGKFDLIVSILTFPFIEKIEQTIKDLHRSLAESGYLCFVAFNEDWVRTALKNGVDYERIPGNRGIKKLMFNFGKNRKVEVFHRSANEYDKIFAGLGCKKLMEEYPLFTKKFISKVYPQMPENISEYMILGYKK
ncbi:MAG: class I SAM-dependent methyltransferase [Candidatus Gracilibacteria bacterium]|jgi:ubiquinone/menaquinone biosynthesis C-methylase UbiE